jgi:hypothetical protein
MDFRVTVRLPEKSAKLASCPETVPEAVAWAPRLEDVLRVIVSEAPVAIVSGAAARFRRAPLLSGRLTDSEILDDWRVVSGRLTAAMELTVAAAACQEREELALSATNARRIPFGSG